MGDISTISAYKPTIDKLGVISGVTKKPNSEILRQIINELETLLADSVQYSAKNGKTSLFYNLDLKRSGLTLQIMFVPRLKVVSEKVPLDSEAPTTEEIEKKVFEK